MASLARKILIFAAVDGLVVQPLATAKGQRPAAPVKVRYRDGVVVAAASSRESVPARDDNDDDEISFEAFGVIGLFTVSRLSFLVSITQRLQVGRLLGSPVYVVTGVAVTPCSSRAEAESAITETAAQQRRQERSAAAAEAAGAAAASADRPSFSSEDSGLLQVSTPADQAAEADEVDEIEDEAAGAGTGGRDREAAGTATRSTIARDVISRRGTYGRFARRWFSRAGWVLDQKRSMGISTAPESAAPSTNPTRPGQEDGVEPEQDQDRPAASALLPKLLRTAQVLFGSSRSFFFSYDVDLTRSLAGRRRPPAAASDVQKLPLYLQADSAFFWNRHLLAPFISAGHHHPALALPLMQGFIGQHTFEAGPEKRYTATVISRRSIRRAGLRYLRRGIDEDGHAANSVETEQVLAPADWDFPRGRPDAKAYSFVQVRGSIPLFFTQTPYAFKPAPVIQHSDEANLAACRRHFGRLKRRYGSLHVVSLVEKTGSEAVIGEAYRRIVARLNEKAEDGPPDRQIPFEWFDFHQVCRGMKFERVAVLLEKMRPVLDASGSTVETADGSLGRTQAAVLRTNCMDCLDRTNVCQSSFARHMLEAQLREDGVAVDPDRGADWSWFDWLWADNGDAVSKQYASTAAMKGDYTRTRKRDYRGTLNDMGLSLTRFYNGMVNDYFSQAAIDFFLGNVTAMVFEEFEADMMTRDPAVSVLRMREQAIELCRRRVIADESEEEFVGGWVLLLSPAATTTATTTTTTATATAAAAATTARSSAPLVEAVLLLTEVAVYVCRFDWNLDKVSSFERIALGNVTGIRFGAYVTSTVSPAHLDENRNVGLVLEYRPGGNDVRRKNTRTPSNLEQRQRQRQQPPPPQRVVLKAPYSTSSLVLSHRRSRAAAETENEDERDERDERDEIEIGQTEMQLVTYVCAEIDRFAARRRLEEGTATDAGAGAGAGASLVERMDIVSAEEAKRSTGLLETLGHSLKRMVWA